MPRAITGSGDGARTWLARVDGRLPLSHAGLGAGVAAGAVYTLQSASHMTVQSPEDIYVVGALLAVIGGILGWLTGELLRRPLRPKVEQPDGKS